MPNDVKSTEEAEYNKPEVAALLIFLTEATRAQQDSVPGVFIPPAGIEQVESKYHHIIFGQRGSGKSSLLRYLEGLMRRQHRVTAWIDQEIFAQLDYPDVLVSCVLEIINGIIDSLARENKLKVGILARFGRTSSSSLEAQLTRIANNLRVLKFAPLNAEIQWVHKVTSSDHLDVLGSVKASNVGVSVGATANNFNEVTSTQTVTTSKGEYLERSLVDFRKVIKQVTQTMGGGFVFVDDLYLIGGPDQPRVLGYLHRLLKDTGLWLKVGSIRHATNNYLSTDPPVGMQLRHDAHEMALDRQFTLFDTTKSFLEAIVGQLARAASVDYSRLFTDGALSRLMLASGGVARDYLLLARGSIEEAREHGPGKKSGSHRVSVEDVNSAAGKIAPTKLDDLRKDTPDEAEAIQDRVIDLTNFCRDRKSGYFLVDTRDRVLMRDLNALQHLRFAHLLFQSETIPDRQSERFNVYLLDLAQLSYQRATEGVDFEGWADREKRRARKLVYGVDWSSQRRATPTKGFNKEETAKEANPDPSAPTLF